MIRGPYGSALFRRALITSCGRNEAIEIRRNKSLFRPERIFLRKFLSAAELGDFGSAPGDLFGIEAMSSASLASSSSILKSAGTLRR